MSLKALLVSLVTKNVLLPHMPSAKEIVMPCYTCLCEDEPITNNCSQECDLCGFGHIEGDPNCDCIDCESHILKDMQELSKPDKITKL
jgi:hypothetical protein